MSVFALQQTTANAIVDENLMARESTSSLHVCVDFYMMSIRASAEGIFFQSRILESDHDDARFPAANDRPAKRLS